MHPNVKTKTFTISIILKQDPDGVWVIRVEPPPDMDEVLPSDTIRWVCKQNYSFAVLFGFDSPLGYMGYPSQDDEKNKGVQIVKTEIVPGAPFGRHKYFIAACVNNQIVFSDPDVVVRPRRS